MFSAFGGGENGTNQIGVGACLRDVRCGKNPAVSADLGPGPGNPDGSTTVYFGPSKPDGVADGNWIETVPGKGWFTILRLYSPLESFFTKAWRPSEIENIAGK